MPLLAFGNDSPVERLVLSSGQRDSRTIGQANFLPGHRAILSQIDDKRPARTEETVIQAALQFGEGHFHGVVGLGVDGQIVLPHLGPADLVQRQAHHFASEFQRQTTLVTLELVCCTIQTASRSTDCQGENWTDDEKKKMRDLLDEGIGLSDIAGVHPRAGKIIIIY